MFKPQGWTLGFYPYPQMWDFRPRKTHPEDFPGSPAVKTWPPDAGGMGLIPSQQTKVPHALSPKNQNPKTEAML